MKKTDRTNSFGYGKLQTLDKVIAKMRMNKLFKKIDFNNKVVIDVGCGYNANTLQYIKTNFKTKKCIAIDINLNTQLLEKMGIKCIIMDLNNIFPLDEKADIIIATAIIEHISSVEQFINFIYNTLNSKGILLATIPSTWAKPLLEFMAFRLKIINKEEILDHKEYYNKKKVFQLFHEKCGIPANSIHHKYFQFFMNNFIKVNKP